ncbi:AraC family transcriptional regulator [Escherichia coli]
MSGNIGANPPSLTSLCYIMSYRISVCKRHCHNNFLSRCFLPAFPFFSTHRGFMFLLFRCINSVALKVRYIICSSPSRAWRVKDISNSLYMSESLLKRKLQEEKVSFSQILLDIRMHNARQLISSKLSVNQIAIRCGYASTPYFISVFREYFGITPHQMMINQSGFIESRIAIK